MRTLALLLKELEKHCCQCFELNILSYARLADTTGIFSVVASNITFKLGNKKWFSSTYWAPNKPFSAQKYLSVVCSLRLTNSKAGGAMPSAWMNLRAAVTGLSSPLSMLYCGTHSKILRPSCRRRLLRLRLLANFFTSSVSRQYEQTGCNDSYQIRGQYIRSRSKVQLFLIYRHNLNMGADRQKCSGCGIVGSLFRQAPRIRELWKRPAPGFRAIWVD